MLLLPWKEEIFLSHKSSGFSVAVRNGKDTQKNLSNAFYFPYAERSITIGLFREHSKTLPLATACYRRYLFLVLRKEIM